LSLLAVTAVLYIWDLGASGWANSFYSAAVQAGTKSWKAFFFGSSDASNFITVDKPPASLWIMELSARIFGLNAWSILVPQALEGVATVGVLYAAVRRWFSPAAALAAGALVALTPVAALMFRFNNPDALLVLLLTGAAYATVRAIEHSSGKWLILAGSLIGFGFITKMLQAFLVVPAFALAYLLCADTSLRKRMAHLLYSAIALVVASGWWVLAVQLTPAADRPYIGGSQNNSELGLIFGYNGFGRLTGSESGSVVGGGPTGAGGATAGAMASPWGPTGITRLFTDTFGGDISWLLPAALILLIGGLWVTRRSPRTDRIRGSLIIFGGWMVLTGLVFSFAKGIIHPYYTVALAPAIAATVAVGAFAMWKHRTSLVARIFLALSTVATSVWSFVLLDRSPDWFPELRYAVIVVGLVASALIVAGGFGGLRKARLLLAGGIVAAAVSAAAGPLAYTLDTVSTPHSGAIPTAGPTLAGSTGGFGAGPGGAAGGTFGGARPGGTGTRSGATGTPPSGSGTSPGAGGFGGKAGSPPGGSGTGPGAGSGTLPTGTGSPGSTTGHPGGAGGVGGAGGFLNGSTPSKTLVALIAKNADRYTWAAATVGSNSAAGYQLATDDPVMAIGGFNGTDPAPTLSEFETYVQQGKIHWFIASTGAGSGGSGTDASEITAWVKAHYKAQTVGGVTVYDLTS
jgi:4-amino-4-deoxy-L-arabinose transferase-like glycosyltransferase